MSSTEASGLQIDCCGPLWSAAFSAWPSTSPGTHGHSGETNRYNTDDEDEHGGACSDSYL